MAKLQWRNLDIGFSPSVDYDSHLCTPLSASIQSVSTAPFILLITLTLGKPGIPPGTYRCSLRMILKRHSPHSLLCFVFFPLNLSPLNTVYHYSFILCIICLSPLSLSSTKAGHVFCSIYCCSSANEIGAWHIVGAQ